MEGQTPTPQQPASSPISTVQTKRQKAIVRQRRARLNKKRHALLHTFQQDAQSSSDEQGTTGVRSQLGLPDALGEALEELPDLCSSDEDRIAHGRAQRRQELPRQNSPFTSPEGKSFMQGKISIMYAIMPFLGCYNFLVLGYCTSEQGTPLKDRTAGTRGASPKEPGPTGGNNQGMSEGNLLLK